MWWLDYEVFARFRGDACFFATMPLSELRFLVVDCAGLCCTSIVQSAVCGWSEPCVSVKLFSNYCSVCVALAFFLRYSSPANLSCCRLESYCHKARSCVSHQVRPVSVYRVSQCVMASLSVFKCVRVAALVSLLLSPGINVEFFFVCVVLCSGRSSRSSEVLSDLLCLCLVVVIVLSVWSLVSGVGVESVVSV
jgi:hypothetical protein